MDSKLCPVCGTENNIAAKFCRKCGGSLELRAGGGKTEMDDAANEPYRKKRTEVDRGQGQDSVPGAESANGNDRTASPHRQRKHTVVDDGGEGGDRGSLGAWGSAQAETGGKQLVGFLVTFDLQGFAQGKYFPLHQGRTFIGRDCDPSLGVVVDLKSDGKVSKQHALLLHRNGRLIAQDQMSTCGTFVDEESLRKAGMEGLIGGPEFKRARGTEYCGREVRLFSIEDEKVDLFDNSIIGIGDSLLQLKLIGWPK